MVQAYVDYTSYVTNLVINYYNYLPFDTKIVSSVSVPSNTNYMSTLN